MSLTLIEEEHVNHLLVSQDELQKGLIDLFNIAFTKQDINALMQHCNLDTEGNICLSEFSTKMVIDPNDWINPMFILDRGTFISIMYEEWQASLNKQKADLKSIISSITSKDGNVTTKKFFELLSLIGGDNFAGNVHKYYLDDEGNKIDSISEKTVINLIMDNQVGGYASEFFRNYVRDLFPFLHFVYKME